MVPTAGGTSTILNIYRKCSTMFINCFRLRLMCCFLPTVTDPRQRQHSLSPPAITTAAQKRPRRYNLDQVHHRPPLHQCNQQYSLYTGIKMNPQFNPPEINRTASPFPKHIYFSSLSQNQDTTLFNRYIHIQGRNIVHTCTYLNVIQRVRPQLPHPQQPSGGMYKPDTQC